MSRLFVAALLTACFSTTGVTASALSLKDAILYVLETNPDIEAAEANARAIEFELEQARSFRAPRVEVDAWAITNRNSGSATPDLGAAAGSING